MLIVCFVSISTHIRWKIRYGKWNFKIILSAVIFWFEQCTGMIDRIVSAILTGCHYPFGRPWLVWYPRQQVAKRFSQRHIFQK